MRRRAASRWWACAAVVVFGAVSLCAAPAASDESVPNLEGVWAQRVVTTAISDPPMIGEVTSRTTTILRVKIDQRGRNLSFQPETCRVSTSSDAPAIRLEFPERFAEALPDVTRRGRITETPEGPAFRIERHRSVIGARLREPSGETLPDGPDDHRLVDADGDGHPGVTVRVRGLVSGELYIVQRAWDAYRARIHSTDRLRGRVAWGLDQSVVEATSIFLGEQPPTRPHPDPRESYFELVRVSPDVGCRELLERRSKLFES